MRIADPAHDGELIVGRLDGINRDSTLALIDRILEAENNGLYGKQYGSLFDDHLGLAQWYDYSANQLVYGTSASDPGADSWRYQSYENSLTRDIHAGDNSNYQILDPN